MNVQDHYKGLAQECGDSALCSMSDMFTKNTEIKKLSEYLSYYRDNFGFKDVLEVGCGNGYTATQLIENVDIRLTAVDNCQELIDIARNRDYNSHILSFFVDDVTDLSFYDNTFDVVYTERCLINLLSWDKQKKALSEIHRVLKPYGIYIMMEAFTDGLDNLNAARYDIGLPMITQPKHNRFFNKGEYIVFLKDKFTIVNHDNFLSSYYYGSRVLYPALSETVTYNNKFNEFWSFIEPYGNFSYIQVYVLRKE